MSHIIATGSGGDLLMSLQNGTTTQVHPAMEGLDLYLLME